MNPPLWPDALALVCGPLEAIDLALYAAASGDHNPLHLDADVAHAAGFDRPVVHGMLSMACAGRLFTSQFGVGSVQALNTRFTGIALRGDRLLFNAQLSEGDDRSATYTLTARTDRGTDVLSGTARVSRTMAVS